LRGFNPPEDCGADLQGNRQLMEGTAVWNPALADRSTYLFAARMFGSDGYYSHGRFFMWNESMDFTYSNATLHFDPLPPLAQYSSAHARVAQNIGLMGGLRQAIEDKIAASYPAEASSLPAAVPLIWPVQAVGPLRARCRKDPVFRGPLYEFRRKQTSAEETFKFGQASCGALA